MLLLGNMLAFMVGSKQAFEVSLADVSQTQMQGKNDVLLEFHVDDTTGANEVTFYLQHESLLCLIILLNGIIHVMISCRKILLWRSVFTYQIPTPILLVMKIVLLLK